MSARGYRPMDDDRVSADTDILGDLPQRHAKEDLIPIIARKSQNASNVDPFYYEYFQRMKTGRRCSCFDVESEPSGVCKVCYGTGIVGGYNKRGTRTEVFDVTYPNVRCANTTPDYNNPTRPVFWSLIKSSVYGTLEFDIWLKTNVGIVDVLHIMDYQPQGTEIKYYIKSPSDLDFEELTEKSLGVRLGQNKLQFKVTMKRVSPSAPLPKLIGIRMAYRVLPRTEVRVNIPRTEENLTLEELGIIQSFSSKNFWIDTTLRNISTEDWFYNVLDGTRWKVTSVSDNKPMGILTSWDVTCRLVQNFERYAIVPIGKTIEKFLPTHIKSIQTDEEEDEFLLKSNANHLRRPGNRAETSRSDGPHVTVPGQTDADKPLREV